MIMNVSFLQNHFSEMISQISPKFKHFRSKSFVQSIKFIVDLISTFFTSTIWSKHSMPRIFLLENRSLYLYRSRIVITFGRLFKSTDLIQDLQSFKYVTMIKFCSVDMHTIIFISYTNTHNEKHE